MVKKPTIDSSVLQANSIIPSVGMSDPQLIVQAAIAKYVLWMFTSAICVLDLKVYVQYVHVAVLERSYSLGWAVYMFRAI